MKKESIHERIARTLNWPVEDVHSFSMQMLREMVREKNPKLAHEISEYIRSGHYIMGKSYERRRY
jgi:hypothetical protein